MSDYPQQPYPEQQSPPPGYYQGPPPKKSHTLRNVLIGLTLLAILVVGGCAAVLGLAASSVDNAIDEASADHVVTYKVGGTATSASLTYNTDGSTSIAQETEAKVPWEKELTIGGSAIPIYQVSAQNGGKGTVTCEILVDGKSVKKNEAKGEFAIASCDYSG